jgi:hypothetical protein
MLVRRWWICRSSPTSLMEGGSTWSKTAWGLPPVNVPQRHVPRLHVAGLLAMVLSWIWHRWRLDVSFGVHLGGARVGRRPPVSVVVVNPRDQFVFLDLL